MPDSPFDGKRATHKPLPQCKAFIVCKEAEFDDIAGQIKVRMITSTDAGWITPTSFVAPITLVPIDPPRPLNRRRQQ